MSRTSFLPLLLAPLLSAASLSAADSNDRSLVSAFDSVAEDGVVIIYAHGSDWNPAGKLVAKSIWENPAFRASLPSKAQLCTADFLENPRFKRVDRILLTSKSIAPASTNLTVEGGPTYTKGTDGSWSLDKLEAKPRESTYALAISTAAELTQNDAIVLTLTPPVSAIVAASHPGLTKNGRITVSELTISDANGKKIPVRSIVTSEDSIPQQPTTRLTDGDESANGTWTSDHNNFRNVNFLIFPSQPIPANAKVTLTWTVKSVGQDQLPVEIKVQQSALGDPTPLTTMAENEEFLTKLPIDTKNLPALFAFDKQRKLIAKVTPVLVQHDPAAVAQKLNSEIKTVTDAEATIASAANQADPHKKIELIVKGAEALGSYLDGNRRKQLVAEIAKLDPDQSSPYRWRFDFNTSEFNTKLTEAQKNGGLDAAFAFIDQTVRSPRASQLNNEQKQLLVLEKFKRARADKKTWPELVPYLKEVAKIDPTTHTGIGAIGQIDSNGLGDPSMAFGFWPTHLKAGKNTLTVKTGLAVLIPVNGSYELQLTRRAGSKGTLTIHSASIVDKAGNAISTHKSDQKMDDTVPTIKIPLSIPAGAQPDEVSIQLQLTAEAPPAASCTFIFRPTLPIDGEFSFR